MIADQAWGGVMFRLVGPVELERDSKGKLLEFLPQQRYTKASSTPLHKYGSGPFCCLHLTGAPTTPAVYIITSNREVRYVGQTDNLAERWGSRQYGSIQPRNCYVRGQATNCKINHLIRRDVQADRRIEVYYTWVPNKNEREELERRLETRLRPPWNGRICLLDQQP